MGMYVYIYVSFSGLWVQGRESIGRKVLVQEQKDFVLQRFVFSETCQEISIAI